MTNTGEVLLVEMKIRPIIVWLVFYSCVVNEEINLFLIEIKKLMKKC